METDNRKQNTDIKRYKDPRVTPLELWDLWVGDRILWEVMGDQRFPQILAEVLVRLRGGEGRTRSEGPVSRKVQDFDAVFITGGGSEPQTLQVALTSAPFPVLFSDEGAFAGERGGLDLLRAMGCFGYVIDLGQRQLKVSGAGKRWTFSRDFQIMPIQDSVSLDGYPYQRQLLRRFLAEKIQLCISEAGKPPEALITALPSRLNDEGIPEGSSYAGMAGDGQLMPDVLALTDLSTVPVLLMNDAELAAISVLGDPRISQHKRTLVITLGFGVGAALIEGLR